MHSDNVYDRIATLEKSVEELRRTLLWERRQAAAGGGIQMLSVELDEDMGATTTGLADCNVLAFDGTDDSDAGENVDVYDWLGTLTGLSDGDKARAVFSRARNRWEFLSAMGLQVFVGKTAAAISKGAVGTINLWEGDIGSLPLTVTSGPETIGALNLFADLGSGKYAAGVRLVERVTGAVLLAGEC